MMRAYLLALAALGGGATAEAPPAPSSAPPGEPPVPDPPTRGRSQRGGAAPTNPLARLDRYTPHRGRSEADKRRLAAAEAKRARRRARNRKLAGEADDG